jgi:uncharacterized protein (TIGR02001 family)
VTAAASIRAWRAGPRRIEANRRYFAAIAAASLFCRPSPAAAQLGAALSILNDDRFRGYSLSDGRPVGILDLSYDASDGFYAALSGSLVASRGDGPRPLGLTVNGGYAKRLRSGLTVDVGVTHSNYSTYAEIERARSYTEVYAGLSGKLLSARIYASPDYLRHGSLYGELEGSIPAADKLRLTGHVGLLVPLRRSSYGSSYGRDVDWRIGVVRQFGPFSLQAAWTAVRPSHDVYKSYHYHRRGAVVVGLTYAL